VRAGRSYLKWLAWHKVIIDLGLRPDSFLATPVFQEKTLKICDLQLGADAKVAELVDALDLGSSG
jgi:hypothetical protein